MFYRNFTRNFHEEYAVNPENGETRLNQSRIDGLAKYVATHGSLIDIKVPNGGEFIYSFYELIELGVMAELITDFSTREGVGLRISSECKPDLKRVLRESKKFSAYREKMKAQAGNRPPSVFPRFSANGNR